MLPLTLCSWPQWPTMRFVSRREPLALSNIRTIIIKKRDDSYVRLQAPAHCQFVAKRGGLEDWESTSFCYCALTVCPWHRRFFVVWLAVFSIVNIEHCLLRDFFWVNNSVLVCVIVRSRVSTFPPWLVCRCMLLSSFSSIITAGLCVRFLFSFALV